MSTLILYGLIAGLFSLIGGLVVLWRANTVIKYTTWFVTFAAGAFLAVGFLHLLPEAVELVNEPHPVFMAALIGIFLFFSLERLLMKYFPRHTQEDGHAEHTEALPILVVAGDTLHNFLDGIVIALAFVIEPALGLVTAIAVAAHEIPQEVADFAILLDAGWSKLKVLVVNIVSSLATVVGVVAGYFAAMFFEGYLAYMLAGTAGIFIYIASSDLIPEIHHRAGHKYAYRVMLTLLLGLVVVGYVVLRAHGHEDKLL